MADNEGRSARMRQRERKLTAYIVGTAMVLGVLVLLFWQYVFVTILPGNVGVLYSWLFGGTRIERIYGEGLAMKLPWNRIYIFETRTQTRDDRVIALSAEGLEIGVELSTLFRVRRDQAGNLLQRVGPNYEERIVRPLAIGAVREVIARFSSNELYTVDFVELEKEIHDAVRESEYAHMIDFTNLVLRQLELPQQLLSAIEQKLTQEQLAGAYVFRLEQERQEASRRQIEALGIRNFYSIVSSALNENLLTWRGIEATVELSKAPNSKVVIVGSGKDQMPLILGSDIHNLPPPSRTTPMTPEEMPSLDWNNLPRLFQPPDSARGVDAPAHGVETDPVPQRSPRSGGQGSTPGSSRGTPTPGDPAPDQTTPPAGGAQPPTANPPASQSPARGSGADQGASRRAPTGQDTQTGLVGESPSAEGLTPQADDDGLTGPDSPREGFFRLPARNADGSEPTAQPYGQQGN